MNQDSILCLKTQTVMIWSPFLLYCCEPLSFVHDFKCENFKDLIKNFLNKFLNAKFVLDVVLWLLINRSNGLKRPKKGWPYIREFLQVYALYW